MNLGHVLIVVLIAIVVYVLLLAFTSWLIATVGALIVLIVGLAGYARV